MSYCLRGLGLRSMWIFMTPDSSHVQAHRGKQVSEHGPTSSTDPSYLTIALSSRLSNGFVNTNNLLDPDEAVITGTIAIAFAIRVVTSCKQSLGVVRTDLCQDFPSVGMKHSPVSLMHPRLIHGSPTLREPDPAHEEQLCCSGERRR